MRKRVRAILFYASVVIGVSVAVFDDSHTILGAVALLSSIAVLSYLGCTHKTSGSF